MKATNFKSKYGSFMSKIGRKSFMHLEFSICNICLFAMYNQSAYTLDWDTPHLSNSMGLIRQPSMSNMQKGSTINQWSLAGIAANSYLLIQLLLTYKQSAHGLYIYIYIKFDLIYVTNQLSPRCYTVSNLKVIND